MFRNAYHIVSVINPAVRLPIATAHNSVTSIKPRLSPCLQTKESDHNMPYTAQHVRRNASCMDFGMVLSKKLRLFHRFDISGKSVGPLFWVICRLGGNGGTKFFEHTNTSAHLSEDFRLTYCASKGWLRKQRFPEQIILRL